MKPQKPNRRKSREAAVQVLFCQSFTDQEMPRSTTAVESTQVVEAFKENLRALEELRTATEAAIRSINGVMKAYAEAAKQPVSEGKRTIMKGVEEGTLSTRLHLINTRRETLETLKRTMQHLKDVDALFEPEGFTDRLLSLFERNRERIEGVLERSLEGWTLRRLTAEDGAMLRLGVTELLYAEDVPPKVVVNEYLEMAKLYGDNDSPRLVNAVLDRVMRDHPRPDPKG